MDTLFRLSVIHQMAWGHCPAPLGTRWAPPEAVVILKVMNQGQVQGMEQDVSETITILRKYQGTITSPEGYSGLLPLSS